MKTTLEINGSMVMALRDALMIYRSGDGRAAYVTHHEALNGQLGPATALTGKFLEQLQEELSKGIKMEVLPENVLARTSDTIVWWTPQQRRSMFFTDAEQMEGISGRTFPQPPLVWMAKGSSLWVRALVENARPNEQTTLAVAPYWNVNDRGLVCLGDSPTPSLATTKNIGQWVDGFFASKFSHPNADKLVRGAGRYHIFLRSIEQDERFPYLNLLPAKQTLGQFIGGN